VSETSNRLPTIFNDDDDDEFDSGLVKGTRLKFVDKLWSTTDGTPLNVDVDRFLVVGRGYALQRWVDGRPEVITERPLPNLKELNASVPREAWPIGKYSNQPEEPWKGVFYFYLVRVTPDDACLATSINNTNGQRVAYVKLKDKIKTRAMLNGGRMAAPIVKLGWAMMPSDYGPRPRPDFIIDGWRDLEPEPKRVEAPKLAPEAPKSEPVKEPASFKEKLDDDIPF
jgi:hypothetical protein